jgi:hypothetical protein
MAKRTFPFPCQESNPRNQVCKQNDIIWYLQIYFLLPRTHMDLCHKDQCVSSVLESNHYLFWEPNDINQYRQNSESLNVKAGGIYRHTGTLKSRTLWAAGVKAFFNWQDELTVCPSVVERNQTWEWILLPWPACLVFLQTEVSPLYLYYFRSVSHCYADLH